MTDGAEEPTSELIREDREAIDDTRSSSCLIFACILISESKGINAVLLHDHRRALSLMDKSLITYDPAFIRGRARLLSQKAEAYYGLGYIDESVSIAEEALTLARSIGANKTLARVRTLHTTLLQSSWRKERSIAQLGAVLSL
jgi:hypothetical protein